MPVSFPLRVTAFCAFFALAAATASSSQAAETQIPPSTDKEAVEIESDGWFNILSIFSQEDQQELSLKNAVASDTDTDSATSTSMPRRRLIPRRLVPITIAERLQSLREAEIDAPIITESAAMVNPADVIRAVDQAFSVREPFFERTFNIAAAAEAADAAGQLTAELLDLPAVDPLDIALYAMPPEPLDNVFLAAKDAYVHGDIAALKELSPLLSKHLLKDYVELWTLVLTLRAQPDAPEVAYNFERFIELHRGEYIGEEAAFQYLRLMASRMNAERFDFFYDLLVWHQKDSDLAAWHAFYALGTPDTPPKPELLKSAKTLYRDAVNPLSDAYRTLGEAIVKRDRSWAWPRVILLMQRGKWDEVKRVLADVPRPELPASIASLGSILDNPIEWFCKQKDLSSLHARLGVFAALRLSRTSPELAAEIASKCLDRKASAFWRSLVWMRIGYSGTVKLEDKAFSWYRKAGRAFETRPLLVSDAKALVAWYARAALRAGNWYSLNKIIDEMPDSLRADETWVYWRGRALAARGLERQAKHEFERIAGNYTFYGKLAADVLHRPYALGSSIKNPPQSQEIEAWEKDPSLARARALYRMHLYIEGHKEWNWGARTLKDRDFVVLAAYAKEKLLIHRMINTSLRSGHDIVDIRQRYPMPHYALFSRVSQAQQISPAWIYGLIRQESRFIPMVSSSVGAQGLMQVMPATADWLAKRLGVSAYDRSLLTGLEMNLVLGSAYLHMLFADLDSSYVLATAAYNAGPAKARSWRAALSESTESAVFIETIPYYETRGYVKNVLSNTLTYSVLLGNPIKNFTSFIGRIHPSYATNPNIP